MPVEPKKEVLKKLCDFIWGEVCNMERLANGARNTGYEQAFTVCQDDKGDFFITESCVGSECKVSPPSCPSGTKTVGYVHSHPAGVDEWSPSDIYYGIAKRMLLACLSVPQKVRQIDMDGTWENDINLVKCVSLRPNKIFRLPPGGQKEIKALLEEAIELGHKLTEYVLKGQGCRDIYTNYSKKLKKAMKFLEDLGYIDKCKAPEAFGEWRRVVERKRSD